MARAGVVMGVVLMALLAGCSLGGSPAESRPNESVTPAPVPTVEQWPPAPSQFPIPGITNESTVSPKTLARAHHEALSNRSIRITERRNWTITGGNERDQRVITERSAVRLADGSYQANVSRQAVFLRTGAQTNETIQVFRNDTVHFRRSVVGSNVSYVRVDQPYQSTLKLWNTTGLVQQSLSVKSASVEQITWQGETHYRIVGDGAAGGFYTLTDSFHVEAIVQGNGVVRRLTVEYTGSSLGKERVVRYAIAIDPIERDRLTAPLWVPEALNRTG